MDLKVDYTLNYTRQVISTIIIVVLMALLLTATASSDNTPIIVNKLIKDHVNMLDWGIDRIKRDIDNAEYEKEIGLSLFPTKVYYATKSGKITIDFSVRYKGDTTSVTKQKEICMKINEYARNSFFMFFDEENRLTFSIANYFRHSDTEITKSFMNEVENIVLIIVRLLSPTTEAGGRMNVLMTSESNLSTDSIRFH